MTDSFTTTTKGLPIPESHTHSLILNGAYAISGSLHEVRAIYDQINCIDESPFFSAEVVSHNAKVIWGKFESLVLVDWNGVRHVHSDFVHKRLERAKRRGAASYYSAKERFDAAKDHFMHPYFVWMTKTSMKELFGSAQGWSFAREQEDRQGK